jgi:hypothetical protein
MARSDVMFIPRRMHRSPAFRKLTATAIRVFFEFRFRCQFARAGNRGKWHHVNNGELIFTYAQAKTKFGIARSTFRNCIDQLIKRGFIDIAHQGGGMMKDCSKYSISERWRDYGKEEYIKKSRQKDNRKLGFTKKDWESKTGRKRKLKSNISITDDTCSSITSDTRDLKNSVTPSITDTTHQTEPNYHISKGLEVLKAMYPARYH